MESGVKEAVLNTVEIVGSGDYIQEMGTGILKAKTEGEGLAEMNAKYVVVWKKTADGWKRARNQNLWIPFSYFLSNIILKTYAARIDLTLEKSESNVRGE